MARGLEGRETSRCTAFPQFLINSLLLHCSLGPDDTVKSRSVRKVDLSDPTKLRIDLSKIADAILKVHRAPSRKRKAKPSEASACLTRDEL